MYPLQINKIAGVVGHPLSVRFSTCDTLVLPEYQMVQDSSKLHGIRQIYIYIKQKNYHCLSIWYSIFVKYEILSDCRLQVRKDHATF